MHRSKLPAVGLLLLSLGFSLLAAEALVRLLRPQPRLVIAPPGLYLPDPPGRYRLAPGYRGRIYNRAEYSNTIRINRQGLRGAELLPASPQRLRLLTLGDSFAFGVGVEDSQTYIALLADSMTRDGVAAEALNGGIPAFGIPDAESWFRRHGARLRPDVVIVSIFLGNDLVDASPDREEVLIVDGLLAPSQSPQGLRAWLHRHSHLFLMLKELLQMPALRPLRSKLGLGEPWTLRVLRQELETYAASAAARLQPAIEATDQALGQLAAQARDQGFVLVALVIPSELQVDPERWEAALASLRLDAEDYDPEIPRRIVRELLDRHQILTLDLTSALAERIARNERLYFRYDRHWTASGHALAARELARVLPPAISSRRGSDALPE